MCTSSLEVWTGLTLDSTSFHVELWLEENSFTPSGYQKWHFYALCLFVLHLHVWLNETHMQKYANPLTMLSSYYLNTMMTHVALNFALMLSDFTRLYSCYSFTWDKFSVLPWMRRAGVCVLSFRWLWCPTMFPHPGLMLSFWPCVTWPRTTISLSLSLSLTWLRTIGLLSQIPAV